MFKNFNYLSRITHTKRWLAIQNSANDHSRYQVSRRFEMDWKSPLAIFLYITWRPLKSLLYLRVIYVSSYPNKFTYMDNNIRIDFNRITLCDNKQRIFNMKVTQFHSYSFDRLLTHMTLNRPYEGLDGGLSYITVVRKKRTDVYTIRIKSLFLFSFLNRIANSRRNEFTGSHIRALDSAFSFSFLLEDVVSNLYVWLETRQNWISLWQFFLLIFKSDFAVKNNFSYFVF
jgi:hypothetical protein